ncbi:MAG: bifunctional oligoribonuclease/PAP phosphatase NrnA [Ignavibacteriae bacterium]|nr:bifunctional oligoribonuclease/PAP phosphatase NrnA [Ignavibacteriota bacterium]
MTQTLEAVARILHQQNSFVLTTHVNPDGDGLGSEVALAEWLASRGKQVTILNHSATPDFYLFLDPKKRIRKFSEAADAQSLASSEVIIVLDTNHTDRLRSMESRVLASSAIKICIDHHLDPQPFAQHYIIDDEATSTGEIVYRLLLQLDAQGISPLIAQALYCAIMTDTGSFRFPRVDAETHRIVAHLIECGADPVQIYHRVYEQWSAGRIQLLGDALASLKTEYGGRLAHITITQENLKQTGTNEVDTDNFTIYPMNVAGVVAGIFFLELNDGVKISFRSKGEIPINELAKMFGGNGHKNAAGARLRNCTLAEIRNQVLQTAKQFVS